MSIIKQILRLYNQGHKFKEMERAILGLSFWNANTYDATVADIQRTIKTHIGLKNWS